MPPGLERELQLHARALRGLARALVGEHDVDDLLQDTAIAALTSTPPREHGIGMWLAGIVRHLANRHHRRERRRRRREQLVARSEVVAAPSSVDDRDAFARLCTAVMALPEPYQSTLLARYLRELSPPQIAAQMGVPVATVKTRLLRGLQLLRERFASERDDWREGLLVLAGLRCAGRGGVAAVISGVMLMGTGVKLLLGGVGAAIAVMAALWFAAPVAPRGAGDLQDSAPAAMQAAVERKPQLMPSASSLRSVDAAALRRVEDVVDRGALAILATEQGGQPVAGMDFYLVNPADRDAIEPQRCTTDATGVARADGLCAGAWRICMSPAKGAGWREVAIHKDEVTKVTLTVPTFRTVRGRVVDEDGVPIAGAIVNAFAHKPWELPDWHATTDERGEFALAAVRLPCTACAVAAGHLQSQVETVLESTALELVCSRGGGSIKLRLQPDEGIAKGAIATLLRRDKGRSVQLRQCECEHDGSARFTGLAAGEYCVRAELEGFVPAQQEPVLVATGQDVAVSLPLQRGANIAGVVCQEDGSIVEGARVECRIGDSDVAAVVSDAAGRLLLRGVAPGPRTVVARHGSVGVGQVETTVDARGAEVRIVLHEGITLSGVAIDEDGHGIAGVQVVGEGRGAQYVIKASTDGEGNFVLRGLPDDGLEQLRFYEQHHREVVFGAAELDGRPVKATLKRRELRRNKVVGVVVDEAGVPVGGAQVSASMQGERDGCIGQTDASTGRFELEGRLGDYRLTVKRDDYVDAEPKQFALAPGAPFDAGVLVLKHGRRIQLRFAGAPPIEANPGAVQFFVYDREQKPYRWMPRLGASYVSPCLAAGTYYVMRHIGDGWQLVRKVDLGSTEDVVLSLDR